MSEKCPIIRHTGNRVDEVKQINLALAQLCAMSGGSPTTPDVPTDEEIPAGRLVNLYRDAGVVKMRLADASSVETKAHGFVDETVPAGQTGDVFHSGINPFFTGLQPNRKYYLSDQTPGAINDESPLGDSKWVQIVGHATDSETLYIEGEAFSFESHASEPGNTLYTSNIYPIESVESISAAGEFQKARLGPNVIDEISAAGTLSALELRNLLLSHTVEPEEIEASGALLALELRTLMHSYTYVEADEVEAAGSLLALELDDVLVTHDQPAEEITAQGTLVGLELT